MSKVTPKEIYPGYELLEKGKTVTERGVFIPLSSIPNLDASISHPDTGDGRVVIHSLVETAYNSINSLADSAKPKKLVITKNTPTGIDSNTIKQNYTISCTLKINSNTSPADET
jgi:hypothetical protein